MGAADSAYYLKQFEKTIQLWIDNLDAYNIAVLLQKPADNSWSMGQVYMHIIDDTNYFAGQIKLALESDENADKLMHKDAAAIFGNDGFPDIKIVNTTADQPPQPSSTEAVRNGLNTIKQEITAVCTNHNLDTARGKTRHPGLLYFSALEWLRFAEMHMRHHLRQKKRIDEALSEKSSR